MSQIDLARAAGRRSSRLPRRAGAPGPVARAGLPLAGAVLAVVGWEAAAHLTAAIPAPAAALTAVLSPDHRSAVVMGVRSTLSSAATGFGIGAGIAVVLGTLVVLQPWLRSAVGMLATFTYAFPTVVLGPVLVITAGPDLAPMELALVATCFPVFVAFVAGLFEVQSAHEDVCRSFGAGRVRRFWLLHLPSALPGLLNGLKIGASIAVLGAILGEWFGASQGIGILMLGAMQQFDTAFLWGLAIIATVGTALAYAVLAGLERLAARRFGTE